MQILGEITLLGQKCSVVEYDNNVRFCTSIKTRKASVLDSHTYMSSFKHYIKHKFGTDKYIPLDIVEELIQLSRLIDKYRNYYNFEYDVHVDEKMIYLTNKGRPLMYGDYYNGDDRKIELYVHKVKDQYVFTNGTSKAARHYKLMKKLLV